MTDTPIVRAAAPADLDALARMGADLARLHHALDGARFMLPPDIEPGYRAWFAKELTRKGVLLAVATSRAEGRRVDGYVYGRLAGVDWASLLDAHAALVDLWVDPDARRRGAARALVEHFAAWARARGAPRVVLSTAAGNEPAQAFFLRAGFRATMVEMTREL